MQRAFASPARPGAILFGRHVKGSPCRTARLLRCSAGIPSGSSTLSAWAVLPVLLHAGPSLAGTEQDTVSGFGQAAEGVAVGAAEGVAGTDPVIGVLFTLAVAALSVITLGVRACACCLCPCPCPCPCLCPCRNRPVGHALAAAAPAAVADPAP